MIRPLVVGAGYRFTSLEPRLRSSKVSESVRLPVGRFVSVQGLEEGTLSVRIRVRDSQRPGPIALAPVHRIVQRTVRSRLQCTGRPRSRGYSVARPNQGEGSQGQEAPVGSSDGVAVAA
jgi:hypothetical protein